LLLLLLEQDSGHSINSIAVIRGDDAKEDNDGNKGITFIIFTTVNVSGRLT
jgi:hypothetical protein